MQQKAGVCPAGAEVAGTAGAAPASGGNKGGAKHKRRLERKRETSKLTSLGDGDCMRDAGDRTDDKSKRRKKKGVGLGKQPRSCERERELGGGDDGMAAEHRRTSSKAEASRTKRRPTLATLLGHFTTLSPARCNERICSSTPATLPRLFQSHSVRLFPDTTLDSLNPGWEPTLHVFRLQPKLAARLNPRLAGVAMKVESETKGLQVSNKGGFHSDQFLFEQSAGEKAVDLLCDLCATAVRCAEKEEGGKAVEARPTHSWVNVSRAGAYNGLHDHSGATWSGCYYVQCPPRAAASKALQSGEFIARVRVGGLGGDALGKALSAAREGGEVDLREAGAAGWCTYAAVDPEPGMLLLFPSWVKHCVMPLLEDGPRISIAFNVGQQDE